MSETIDAIAKELERLEGNWGGNQTVSRMLQVIRYQWEVIDEWVPADITFGTEKEILAILRGEVSKPKGEQNKQ